jgi:N-methylhydantoinase A
VVSPRRRDVQRSVLLAGESLTAAAIAEATTELGRQARRALHDDRAELSAVYELRYRGQAFELPIGARLDPDPNQLRSGFEALHEQRYGYSDEDQTLELVTIRVTATVPGVDVTLTAAGHETTPERVRRTAMLAGEELELEVLRGALPPGTEIRGPAVVELPESTLLVPPRWTGQVDATGTIRIEKR